MINEREEPGQSSKRPKIDRIVKAVEQSLVGVLNEMFGMGLTPPSRSTLPSSLDLSEGSMVLAKPIILYHRIYNEFLLSQMIL